MGDRVERGDYWSRGYQVKENMNMYSENKAFAFYIQNLHCVTQYS